MKQVEGRSQPEIEEVNIGFMPLTDCAPLVIASELGFDRKFGLRMKLNRLSSWAAVRDKLLTGELHAAQTLYGLIYGVHMGIGGIRRNMANLMTLSRNGQAITLSNRLRDEGVVDGFSLAQAVHAGERRYFFAQTFPTGTHAMWLYYWLAAQGVHPLNDVNMLTVPPPQMVTAMRQGDLDGFCAGEPWNARAIRDQVGFTVVTSQQIWADHPEKSLGATAEWVDKHPHTVRALIMAVLDASRYIEQPDNLTQVAEILSRKEYVDTDADILLPRMLGQYDDGNGHVWQDAHPMAFFNEGKVNVPYLSDGMWFLAQQRRWGLLRTVPDYQAVVRQVNQVDVYRAAAEQLGIAVPAEPFSCIAGETVPHIVLMDGQVWDAADAERYAMAFAIHS